MPILSPSGTFFSPKYSYSVPSECQDQARRVVGPDLGPNYSQMLSAEKVVLSRLKKMIDTNPQIDENTNIVCMYFN